MTTTGVHKAAAIDIARAEAEAARQVPRQSSEDRWRPKDHSEGGQVYSLRIPTSRLAQLKKIADRLGKKPTVLLRQWVLERLDLENAKAEWEIDKSYLRSAEVHLAAAEHSATHIGVGTYAFRPPTISASSAPAAAYSITAAISRSKYSA